MCLEITDLDNMTQPVSLVAASGCRVILVVEGNGGCSRSGAIWWSS